MLENAAGLGASFTPITVCNPCKGPNAISVADVDGDGDKDILISNNNMANDGTGSLDLFITGGAAGDSWTKRTIASGGTGYDSVALKDMTGDGKPDLLYADSYKEVGYREQHAC